MLIPVKVRQLATNQFEDIIDLLALLSGDPIRLIDQPDTRYTISAYVRYAIEPSVQDVSGWLVDKIDYRGQTKIYATFPAQTSTQWIEAGQAITANVSVTWDDTNMAIGLQIHDYQLGGVPDPRICCGTKVPHNGVIQETKWSTYLVLQLRTIMATGGCKEMVPTKASGYHQTTIP